MTRWLPLLLALAAVGCEAVVGDATVEAFLQTEDDPRTFRLAPVVLESAENLATGRGSLFDVRGGFDINGVSVVEEIAADRLGYEDMVVRGRRDPGDDVAPRMTWDGDMWLADDFDTLQYFTMFHNVERAWVYARDVMGDDSEATREKSLLAMYGTIARYDALPIPVRSTDNAAYVAYADAWLTFRTVLVPTGVPFAMNPGVIAHEFHHRVFFQNVFRGDAFENWRAWVTGSGDQRAGNLLRGLDEGLADIFAVAVTRDPSFMSLTLEGFYAAEAPFRDLDAEFAERVTYDGLSAATLPPDQQNHCGFAPTADDQLATPAFRSYCAGTAVARALWEGADFDFDVLESVVLPAVNRSLPELGRRIAVGSGRDELVFDLDLFLDASAAEMPASVRADVCVAYRAHFESLLDEGRVPACD